MRAWFRIGLDIVLLAGLLGLTVLGAGRAPAAAQQPSDTPGTAYILNSYVENVNVHTGPSAVYFPTIGQIVPGDTAPAVGRSSGGDWIQIQFPGTPDGLGWVYSPLVQLFQGDNLPVVSSPPTPTPGFVNTIDPTVLAEFQPQPTPTRMPTFSPAPPLTVPTFAGAGSASRAGIPAGWLILLLGLLGAAGLLVTYARRR